MRLLLVGRWWAVAVLVLGVSTGCRPDEPAQNVAVAWDVRPDPPRVGSTFVAVALADTAGEPIRNARVEVEATMTHPGMAPERAAADELEPGRYEAAVNLSMGGDWVLLLQAELPDGRVIQRRHDFPGVAAE